MEDNKLNNTSGEADLAGINSEADDCELATAISTIKREEEYTNDSAQLRVDINNANTMLTYILDRGIDIDSKCIEVVIDCKDKFKRNKWTKEDEKNFYMTYKELTKTIKPVTVDSLASSKPSSIEQPGRISKFFGKNKRWSLHKRSTTLYTLITMGVMLILLFVQIFFYLGSTRIDNINLCEAQINELNSRLAEIEIIVDKDPENSMYQREKDDKLDEVNAIDSRLQCNINLLEPWIRTVRKVSFNTTIETDTIAINNKNIIKANNAIIQEARSYVLILGIYVLPLLYGIIGGFTFVLRELTSEIKTLTFAPGSNIKYVLRILLGAIAGLSIGLFWGDIKNSGSLGLSSLSPMLLAFIGGYCVEYLLQFIESITTTFFSKRASFFASQPVKDEQEPAKSEEPAEKSEK